MDPSWNPDERRTVCDYLRAAPRNTNWNFLGFPCCRFLCGIKPQDLGTGERSDSRFIWPVGFAHYLEQHAVRPPQEFVEHVLRCISTQPAGASHGR